MEFFNRLLLVTCVFAIASTAHAQDPIREEKLVKFETDVDITCTGQDNDQFSWFRGKDREICTPASTWCSQKETKKPDGGTTSTLTLKKVLTNGIYTCKTATSAGDVSITTLKVGPKVQPTQYKFYGVSPHSVTCFVETSDLQVILFRQNLKESCEPKWCTPGIDKPEGASSKNFLVQSLNITHTYLCVAYNNAREQLAITSVLRIEVGPAPENFHVRHNTEVMKGGFDLVEIEFDSKAHVLKRVYKIDDVETDLKEDNFQQNGSEYSYSISVGPVNQNCQLTVVIVTMFGSQTHFVSIVVTEPKAAKYGEDCYTAAICTGTDNTVCDPTTKKCACREGYHWNLSICTNGALGRMVMQKEGIIMLALAVLLTLVRSTK